MKKLPRILCPLLAAAAIAGGMMALVQQLQTPDASIPGLTAEDRTLLRIWILDAPGGAEKWLTQQLRSFEKAHPALSTWVRHVSAQDVLSNDALLPDVLLYMPGSIREPDRLFTPLTGDAVQGGILREALLRCGRSQQQQYALPLCWGAWVLAIDSSLEPDAALTPAPTTLLGRPMRSEPVAASPTPGYPLPRAHQADCALQSPGGPALFTLGMLIDPLDRPPLPDGFGQEASVGVYAGFRQRRWASAMLTTGQMTAMDALASAGEQPACRALVPERIITDQVWLASIPQGSAEDAAALLLAHLTGADAQKALANQGLYPAREDLVLYASGFSAYVERSARLGLAAVNAYAAAEDVTSAAWRFWQGTITLDEALLPLL